MKVNQIGRMLAVAMTILSFVNVSPLLADSIFFNTGFNVTASPRGINITGIHPFDPALGTLYNVSITIQGNMSATVFNTPFGDINNPIPYGYTIGVHQLFYGVPSSIFFEFQDPGGTFIINGHSLGNQDTFAFATSFSYDFRFNDITDLFGGTVPNTSNVLPPPFINGLLENFIENRVASNMIALEQWNEYLGGSGPPPSLITSEASGILMIRYDYTLVPLPTSVLLLGSGFLGLWGLKRKFTA
jgi:hypothetical protein